MVLSLDVCVYILYDHPGFLSATERGSPYSDYAEIVRKPYSHTCSAIFTISIHLRCQYGLPTIISRAYDHFWGPYDYQNSCGVLTSSRSACGNIRGSCDQPAMYLRDTGL